MHCIDRRDDTTFFGNEDRRLPIWATTMWKDGVLSCEALVQGNGRDETECCSLVSPSSSRVPHAQEQLRFWHSYFH